MKRCETIEFPNREAVAEQLARQEVEIADLKAQLAVVYQCFRLHRTRLPWVTMPLLSRFRDGCLCPLLPLVTNVMGS